MLENDRGPAICSVEGEHPTGRRLLAPDKLVEGVQVAIGKRDIKPFHSGAVLELPGLYSLFHLYRDLVIERCEKPQLSHRESTTGQ
jgi:hypothetical protein